MAFRTSPVVAEDEWQLRPGGGGRDRRAHPGPPRQAERLELGGLPPARGAGRPDPLRRPDPGGGGPGRGPGLLCRDRPGDARGPGDRPLPGREGPQLLRGHPLGPRAVPGLLRAAPADRLRRAGLLPGLRFRAGPHVRHPRAPPTTPSSPCPRPRWGWPSTPAGTCGWPTRSGRGGPSSWRCTGRRIDAADGRAPGHGPAGHHAPRTCVPTAMAMAARDRRQRPAGRAVHQAHHRRLRLPRAWPRP